MARRGARRGTCPVLTASWLPADGAALGTLPEGEHPEGEHPEGVPSSSALLPKSGGRGLPGAKRASPRRARGALSMRKGPGVGARGSSPSAWLLRGGGGFALLPQEFAAPSPFGSPKCSKEQLPGGAPHTCLPRPPCSAGLLSPHPWLQSEPGRWVEK